MVVGAWALFFLLSGARGVFNYMGMFVSFHTCEQYWYAEPTSRYTCDHGGFSWRDYTEKPNKHLIFQSDKVPELMKKNSLALTVRVPAIGSRIWGLPEEKNYDAFAAYPSCMPPERYGKSFIIGGALTATDVLSHQLCRQGKKGYDYMPSAEDLLICSEDIGPLRFGLANLLERIQNVGIAYESCIPFGPSNVITGFNATCPPFCANGTMITRAYFAQSYRKIDGYNFDAVRDYLIQYGLVMVEFRAYQDFFVYTGGIYIHRWDSLVTALTAIVYGYGEDPVDGYKYWLCRVPWKQDTFGETYNNQSGYFRIGRYNNNCNFEDNFFIFDIHAPVG